MHLLNMYLALDMASITSSHFHHTGLSKIPYNALCSQDLRLP